jgi:hypothetical protein
MRIMTKMKVVTKHGGRDNESHDEKMRVMQNEDHGEKWKS